MLYFQALATELAEHHNTTDLSDIHLLVKRKLAGMKIGDAGVCQGAEERSSLLSKLLFARYRGRRKANIMDGALESALSFFSLPSSRSSSPMPVKRNILLTNQEKPRPMSAVFSSPCKPSTPEVSMVKISTPMNFPSSTLSRSMSSPSQAFSPSKSSAITPLVLKMPIKKPTNIMHVVEVKSSDGGRRS